MSSIFEKMRFVNSQLFSQANEALNQFEEQNQDENKAIATTLKNLVILN